MTRERAVFQTGPKHRVTLNIVFIIKKMKEKRTQPQKRKKTSGPDETQSDSSGATSKSPSQTNCY